MNPETNLLVAVLVAVLYLSLRTFRRYQKIKNNNLYIVRNKRALRLSYKYNCGTISREELREFYEYVKQDVIKISQNMNPRVSLRPRADVTEFAWRQEKLKKLKLQDLYRW